MISLSDVAFQNNEVTTTTILGKLPFYTSSSVGEIITAGCKLDAFFPYYYEEVFYGEDDCLYDATGKFKFFTISKNPWRQ